jgi:DNA-binding XRE family transcriptional regulator
MSAHTRRLLTKDSIEVTVHGDSNAKFIISRSSSQKLLNYLELLQSHDEDEELIPADEVFRSLDQKYGKVGATIRGFRVRDDLTQKDLAKKLNIHQVHVSQIENGKRVVGKNLAKKLAKLFHTDYRLFL